MALNISPVSSFTSESVDVNYRPDGGPGKHRIGLVVLSSDHATERDFQRMSPGDDVVFYTSRVLTINPVTVENLRTIAPQLTGSASLIVPGTRLDSIAYSCTSGTVAVGLESIQEQFEKACPGVPCTTPVSAAISALKLLNANRIAVLTPYTDDVNAPMAEYIEAHGPEILRFSSFHIASDLDMAYVPPEAIFEAAVQADHPDAEALFISCTALRAAEVIQALEEKLQKPVVTSIQALYWESLRLAGYSKPIPGYGRLMTT